MPRNPASARTLDVDDGEAPLWVGQLRQAITVLAGNQGNMIEAIVSLRTRLDASDARLVAVKEVVTDTASIARRVEEALSSRSEGGGLRAVMEELQGLNASLDGLAESNRQLNATVGALAGQIGTAGENAAVDAATMVAGGGFLQPRPPKGGSGGSGPILGGAASARRTGEANAVPRDRRSSDEG